MSYKVCYVTTLAKTLREFVQSSAEYNIKHGDFDITFISAPNKDIEKDFPKEVKFIPIYIKRGISLTGIYSVIQLYKIFKKENYDLVQYATANAGFYASIAAKLTKVPVRIYSQWGISYVYMSGIKRFLKRTMEKIICSCSTNIQPDSKENLEIVIKDNLYPKEKGNVIGNGSACGVDFSVFNVSHKKEWNNTIREKYNINKDNYVFGYVGRFLKDKGINELLQSFFELEEHYNDINLLLVGGTDIVEGINQELWNKALNDKNIIFTDYAKDREKYFAAMDCLTFPSYHEGFGLVAIEAGAMQVACIATDIPGLRTAIQNNKTGILIPIKNQIKLKQAMEHMLQNRTNDFGKNAAKYVKDNFDREYVCKLIYEDKIKLLQHE